MGSIAKLFTQNLLWRVCYYLTNFILTLFIARHFQATLSGDVFYLINNCSFIVLVLSLSFEAAIVYFDSNKEIGSNKLFYTAIILILSSVFILIAINFCADCFFSYNLGNQVNQNIFHFVIGNLLCIFMSGFYFARKNFKTPNWVASLMNGVLLLLLFFINDNNWLNNNRFISLYFFSFVIHGIILMVLLLKSSSEIKRVSFLNKNEGSKLYQYLSLVFLSNLITFFCYRMDYWFVKHYCNSIELGNYIQVSKLVQLFFVLPSILATVLFPLTSGGEKEKIKSILPLITRTVFFIYSLFSIGLIIIGKWAFPFMFGESFDLMYRCFLFYIPGMISFSGLYAFTSFFSGNNKVIVNLKGCALALIIALVGNVVIIPRFGIYGAASVSSLSYLVYFIFVLYCFLKENPLAVSDFFIFKKSDWNYYKSIFKFTR